MKSVQSIVPVLSTHFVVTHSSALRATPRFPLGVWIPMTHSANSFWFFEIQLRHQCSQTVLICSYQRPWTDSRQIRSYFVRDVSTHTNKELLSIGIVIEVKSLRTPILLAVVSGILEALTANANWHFCDRHSLSPDSEFRRDKSTAMVASLWSFSAQLSFHQDQISESSISPVEAEWRDGKDTVTWPQHSRKKMSKTTHQFVLHVRCWSQLDSHKKVNRHTNIEDSNFLHVSARSVTDRQKQEITGFGVCGTRTTSCRAKQRQEGRMNGKDDLLWVCVELDRCTTADVSSAWNRTVSVTWPPWSVRYNKPTAHPKLNIQCKFARLCFWVWSANAMQTRDLAPKANVLCCHHRHTPQSSEGGWHFS